MKDANALRGLHKDANIVVIGGGKSVLDCPKEILDNWITISANDHAFYLGIEPDYMVFVDHPSANPKIMPYVENRSHCKTITENKDSIGIGLPSNKVNMHVDGQLQNKRGPS